MEILIKPIKDFSFEDVSSFCAEGYIEGIQLDYKRELSPKGLSKHFAALSNTRGGVIIIGVEEDKSTGKPSSWVGIKNDGKLVDRIHQYATGVDPIPSYDVHVTDEKEGKVFILIRIYEGDRTPYYVYNDSNLWVRTGNISNSIDIASPDFAEILLHKKEKARLARELYLKRAVEIFDACVVRAEVRRKQLIVNEKTQFEIKKQGEIVKFGSSNLVYKSQYFQSEVGTKTSMLTITAQPFYPKKSLTTPVHIKNSLNDLQIRNNFIKLPDLSMEPIPEGVLDFKWNERRGKITCHQLYSSGLSFLSYDVLDINEHGNKIISLYSIAALFISFLSFLKNYYNFLKYQGGVVGNISLDNAQDVLFKRIVPDGHFYYDEDGFSLLNKYDIALELDTAILNDVDLLRKYFLEKIKEIYWSVGYVPAPDDWYIKFGTSAGLW